MARLRHGLWGMLCGRPKLRPKRILRMAECEKLEEIFMADEEPVIHGSAEDSTECENSGLMSEDTMLLEEEEECCLLPGLPNEVVVDFILTKVDWTTLYIVSSLNHTWRDVIRKGEVHDARVRTGKVQSLVVMTHAYPDPNDRVFQGVSLYDPSKDAWHLLPPLPRVKGGITSKYECAIVKGKVYVIGGLTIDGAAVSWKAVLMLDLGACRGVWAQCTNMEISRSQFACQVKDNNIYVFGGVDEQDNMLDEAHVYDSVRNSWSQFASMGYKRSSHKAICLDEFFYLCGGNFCGDEIVLELCDQHEASPDQKAITNNQYVGNSSKAQDANFMEIYDSNNDKWLRMRNFTLGRGQGSYFVLDGVLHHLTRKVIEVYDNHSNSWQSFRVQPWSHAGDSSVCAAEVVGDDIFALVLERRHTAVPSRENWALTARCNIVAVPVKASLPGLRSNSPTWGRMKCPYDFNWSSCSIHPLQL